ncbi:transcription factor 25 [Zootermopsis nevadensis]|uniref:Transcription factor 25 n=1 Tax=Zootermopsis nevadensis TaxID=136037 RepID=A0A067R1Y4_ZOONE|nr:transcription factor 25 [Zootermopsis nevadensis]KDR12891.1 Transcription factor 25 [Zootermopsis nevadensis]
MVVREPLGKTALILRKLQGDTDFAKDLLNENSDPESDLEGARGVKKKQPNVNRYDLLNQQSHSESEVKEDDDHETETANFPKEADDAKESRRKKKKKKKKKPEFKPWNSHRSSEDNLELENNEQSAVAWEPAPANPNVYSYSKSFIEARKKILHVSRRNLNPNNELKRKFGSKVVQNEQSKRRGHNRGYLRSSCLVSPKENWPSIGKLGLSMRIAAEMHGVIMSFKYEHNTNYQQIQKMFLEAVESLNPDIIVAIFNEHPYHVDALIQLSDLCKMSEDLQMAAQLIERALYCLECAFHTLFNIATGNCRLDYRRQENRALFITLFKHLTFVGQRACYRTALELCRVLLSLDPDEDPLGVILCVDFYALRSMKYEWLICAYEEWEPIRNVSQLPNFAFSVAMAYFHLDEDPDSEKKLTANDLLQKALIMFPGVILPLLEKCSVQPDSRVSTHPFFTTKAIMSQSPGLSQLIQLYVCRNYYLWKESGMLDWLERNVHVVLDRVDEGDLFVAECEEKRKRLYQKTPLNVLRHIILSDIKEVTATVTDDSAGPILSYDPLPPPDSVNLYVRPQRPKMYEHSSAFTMFFRSLLPNFNINEPVPAVDGLQLMNDAGGGGEAEGAVAARVDLTRSVTSLLDAMRDLLSNIHLQPDVPNDADIDEDSDD